MNQIDVYEHGRLIIDEEVFTRSHWKSFVKLNTLQHGVYFDVLHNGLKFKHYVGVLQVDGLIVNIHPKADKDDDDSRWKGVLLQMLKACGKIKAQTSGNAQLKKQNINLLEVYFEYYLKEIEGLLHRADYFANLDRHCDTKKLSGYVVLNVFFENSTRTRVSFELAARRLGAEVINISLINSSIKKGESLLDTASTLNAMKPDLLIVRHPHSGAPLLFADYLNCSIINAGDGRHEHPTQALLDALTIKRRVGYLEGLKISICGDIANSRVARSNIHLLTIMGADVRCVAPSTLMPSNLENLGVKCFYDMKMGIKDADVVMLLRLQNERMSGTENPSEREYFKFFGLDETKLALASPNAVIMHPGPMNRGVEIASALADDSNRSLIKTQVEMGVAVRMSIIEALNNTKNEILKN